ncbi:MAG TPA: hypothetical protein VGQ69_09950 [Gemmatimonadales bacterium]|nr:hypothetical protein [Gemmatimonadales bacterium]
MQQTDWSGLGLRALAIRVVLAACVPLLSLACDRPEAPPHPLDPLTEQEIRTASRVLAAAGLLGDTVSVASLALLEPVKGDTAGMSRRAEAVLLDRRRALVVEAVIDLDSARMVRSRQRADAQPPLGGMDRREAIRLLWRDPRWTAALDRHGLDSGEVVLEAFGPGVLGEPWESPTHRFVRLIPHERSTPFPWAAPVEGLVAVVDLTTDSVSEVLDVESVPPFRRTGFPPPLAEPALRPLRIAQPRGASFVIRGHEISWQGWAFRYGFHPREGLVLYDVALGPPGGARRRVLSRASIAELLVPYGHPSRTWAFRAVFDAGEMGLGRSAAGMRRNYDVPANAELLDAVLSAGDGTPRRLERVVAVFERDGGLRWRHARTALPARELVIRFVTTIGNYDYGFNWVFGQDGSIAVEIDLTGVLMLKGIRPGDTTAPRFGTTLEPNLSGINHQHFFTFRLDFDVAGTANRVREIDAAVLAHDSANPHGTGFGSQSLLLSTESQAIRDANPATGRIWKIETTEASGQSGPPGFVLYPGPLPRLLAQPAARIAARGAFATHALWVTRYHPGERYPAGDYPSQSPGGEGLPVWTADNESLVGSDLVLWYSVGTVHFPRPEEWPRMPVTRLRFELRPFGFLSPLPASGGPP